jgi:uncharacterized protein
MKNRKFVFLLCLSIVIASAVSAQNDSAYISSDEIIDKGIEYHNNGNFEAAIAWYKKVSECDPNYPKACYETALSYYNMDRYEEAMGKCKEALFLEYHEATVYGLMGSMLDETGKSEEGVEVITKALIRWPYNQNLLYNLAVCYLNLNRPEEAEKILLKSVLYNPYHTRSHLGLAKANYTMGRIAQSYLAFNMVLLLNPSLRNISSFEEAISERTNRVMQPYKYPYLPGADAQKWNELKSLLQSELAFNSEFEYDYDFDYTITRQSTMLFRKMHFEASDTSIYNQLYVRMFSYIHTNYFETYLNYILQNTTDVKVAEWSKKNNEKIQEFVEWAKNYLNEGRTFGFSIQNENAFTKIYHFDEEGKLKSIGRLLVKDSDTRMGNWLIISSDGYVSERGTYINDKAEGEYLVFWPNGNVMRRLTFHEDQLNETNYTYFENGAREGIFNYTEGIRHGLIEKYNSAGDLVLRNHYTNGMADGEGVFYNYKNGFIREFTYGNDTLVGNNSERWLNGNSKLISNYLNGMTEGSYQTYYSNSSREYAMNYSSDTLIGKYIAYYPNNQIKYTCEYDTKGKLTGNYVYYDRDGRITTKESNYTSGALTGTRTEFFPDSSIKYVNTYENDRMIASEQYDQQGNLIYSVKEIDSAIYYKSFFDDGTISLEGLINKDKREGVWRFYNPLGILTDESTYSAGMRQGFQRSFYESGQLKVEYACDSDRIVGEYKEYHFNGKLNTWGNYDRNLRKGVWISYYLNDSVENIQYYSDDIRVGRNIVFHPDGRKNYEEFYSSDGALTRVILYDAEGNAENDLDYHYGSHHYEVQYPGGVLKRVINISDNDLHGRQEQYYPNGQMAYEAEYVHGFCQGLVKRWDHQGNLTFEMPYNMNLAEGNATWYSDNAPSYKSYYEIGDQQRKAYDYHYNGTIAREMNFVDDERSGNTDYYSPEGKLMFRLRFIDNTPKAYTFHDATGNFIPEITISDSTSEIVAYYSNGKVSVRISLKNGMYHGKYETFYATGLKLREVTFVNDDYEGEEVEYFPDQKIRESTTYHAGLKDGLYQLYYENGNLRRSGNYFMNNESETWQVFDPAGKIVETLSFVNGTLYEISKK